MKIQTNQEDGVFRFTLDFTGNETMSHKLLTENRELVDSIKQDIDEAGKKILKKLNHEFQVRFQGRFK